MSVDEGDAAPAPRNVDLWKVMVTSAAAGGGVTGGRRPVTVRRQPADDKLDGVALVHNATLAPSLSVDDIAGWANAAHATRITSEGNHRAVSVGVGGGGSFRSRAGTHLCFQLQRLVCVHQPALTTSAIRPSVDTL